MSKKNDPGIVNPYPNEHSCRLKDPDDFKDEPWARVTREHEGKKYDVIRGKLKSNDEWADQSFRYPKDTWTESEARKHCKDHNGILFEPASGGKEDAEDQSGQNIERCCGAGNENQDQIASGKERPRNDKLPLRCFEGNAKPHERFWTWNIAGVVNQDEEEAEPELELYGYISEYSWFEDDITPQLFKDDLYEKGKGGPITIRVNSGGGDVIAASVMRSILKDYPGRITVKIDGMAFSAAVVVVMAGDKIRIQDTAYMMIHDPAFAVFLALLDINLLDSMLRELKSVRNGIVDTYAAKTGLSVERLTRMMADETWMSAREAVALGFADEVIGDEKPEGRQQLITENAAMVNALKNYRKVPAEVLKKLQPKPVENQTLAPEVLRLRAEAKILKKE